MSTASITPADPPHASDPEQEPTARRPARRRLLIAGAVAAVAVVFTIVAIIVSGSGTSNVEKVPVTVSEARMQVLISQVPQRGMTLGNPSAPVTVTEFADLQCPYCDGYTLAEFPRILKDYVLPGSVKLVFRNLSFIGPDSVTAGRWAAAAAEQNKLWNFADAFYYNQGPENSGYITTNFLYEVATHVPNLNLVKLVADRSASGTLQTLKDNMALAKNEGVTATPTFIIAGRDGAPSRVVGASNLEAKINAAISH